MGRNEDFRIADGCTDRCGVRSLPRGAGLSRRCTVSTHDHPVGSQSVARAGTVSVRVRRTPHRRFSHMCSTRALWSVGGRSTEGRESGLREASACRIFPQETQRRERENLRYRAPSHRPAHPPRPRSLPSMRRGGSGSAGTVLPLERPGIDQAATRVLATMTSPVTTAAPRSMVEGAVDEVPGGAEASGRCADGRGRCSGRSIDPHHS